VIIEETVPRRIRDLLAAASAQHSTIYRLIVEAEPGFHDSPLRLLLNSRRWPYAVNPNLVIDPDSHADQMSRAEAILDRMVTTPLQGKRFLDFGCGSGHVVAAARSLGASAVGYDPIPSAPDVHADWSTVVSLAPYNVVLVHDVLDHVRDEHPIDCLRKIRSVIADDALVYVRCHPWCSRSGTHAYTTLNKAYVHFFFDDDQLEEMGAQGIWTRKVTHPIVTYDDWALKGGFTKVSEDVRREEVEPLWEEEPYLRTLAQEQWRSSFEESLANGTKFPRYQMEIQWVDLVLRKG